MKHLARTVALAAAVATAGCGLVPDLEGSGQPTPGGQGQSGAGASLETYYNQELNWSDCGDGFECARLAVPLDYDDPGRTQLQLAVTRIPAEDADRQVGSLVLNPGGPGGSGVEYARAAEQVVSDRVRARFDVVGFDPRGVAASEPAVRCLDANGLDDYLAVDASPDDNGEVQDLAEVSQELVQGCRERSADLLPHVGTVDAARDMDVLRAALGDDGLTYLGKSYGTYLGAYYAELFPENVRALVLDGALDPELSGKEANLAQAQGFETALEAFVRDCVGRDECPLGTGSVDEAMDRLEDLIARTDREPLGNELGDGREVTQSLTVLGIAAALYSEEAWQHLRFGLDRAFEGDGTVLLQLGDQLIGRRPDGTYTNQTAANLAINCLDRPTPDEVSQVEANAEDAEQAAPHFGEFVMWGTLPCTYWPAEPKQRDIDAAGADPLLVIGTTRDPATPHEWAEALADQLESGVLLSLDGDGHTAYRTGSSCIDRAVDRYIIEGEPPDAGTTCG